ncbi:hypothetical protein OH779_32050 [Actinacidiphila glaucinigra]|uniref:hypothetical protein n=1 Tax=Actinacidiphila glaucinigra TaxID=235986 RepID=UPI0038648A1B
MSGIRSASIAAALLGCTLLLTGCSDSPGPGSDSAAGGTAVPSAEASATADASAEPSPSATPSSCGAVTSPSHSSTAPAKAPQAPVSVPGCRNLAVSSDVKAAVTRGHERAFPRFEHIAPVPHRFFYGQCGNVRYAATPFDTTSSASEGKLVGLQDEGSAMKYSRATSGGDWVYLASDGFPAGPHGCGDIPRALATAWRNCAVAE